jgi:hypothetical protein
VSGVRHAAAGRTYPHTCRDSAKIDKTRLRYFGNARACVATLVNLRCKAPECFRLAKSVKPALVETAHQLVDAMTSNFDRTAYTDTYQEK